MPERRLEPAREHQLAEALQAPPEASAGSFQAARIPARSGAVKERWVGGWEPCLGQGVPLGVCMRSLRAAPGRLGFPGRRYKLGRLAAPVKARPFRGLPPSEVVYSCRIRVERERDWSLSISLFQWEFIFVRHYVRMWFTSCMIVGVLPEVRDLLYPTRDKIRSDKIVGFHDATRLATLHNSAMPGPLTPRHNGTVYWR
jgi:hypothetical protein